MTHSTRETPDIIFAIRETAFKEEIERLKGRIQELEDACRDYQRISELAKAECNRLRAKEEIRLKFDAESG